jgi:plasmid stability protein
MRSIALPDLEDDVLDRLEQQAKVHNRSVEAELSDIVTKSLRPLSVDTFFDRAEQIALSTRGRPQTDSATLLRNDRDR